MEKVRVYKIFEKQEYSEYNVSNPSFVHDGSEGMLLNRDIGSLAKDLLSLCRTRGRSIMPVFKLHEDLTPSISKSGIYMPVELTPEEIIILTQEYMKLLKDKEVFER